MENINPNSETQLQQVSHPLGRHSIKDAMTNLGIKSKNSVNDYKKMLKIAFKLDLPRVLNEDKTLTDEGLQQLKFARKFAGKKDKAGYTQAVWQANPDLAYELPTPVVTPVVTPQPDHSEQEGAQVGHPTFSTNFNPFGAIEESVAITKRDITALDLSGSSASRSQQADAAIANGQQFTQQLFAQMLTTQGSIGTELGEMMAQKIINDAENAKQAKLASYMQASGGNVAPKPKGDGAGENGSN